MVIIETVAIKIAEIFINVGMDKAGNFIKNRFSKKTLSIDEIKKKAQILFVDDDDFSATLEIIRGAGWNVRQINDITNYQSEEIKNSDVIFMDYIGVGKILTPKDEGIGLLKQIKSRYPKKFVIFYSGYAGFIPGHEFHSIADAWIDKHADPYVYLDQIELAVNQIYGEK